MKSVREHLSRLDDSAPNIYLVPCNFPVETYYDMVKQVSDL